MNSPWFRYWCLAAAAMMLFGGVAAQSHYPWWFSLIFGALLGLGAPSFREKR